MAATMVDLLILLVAIFQKNSISGKMRLLLEECKGNSKYARFADSTSPVTTPCNATWRIRGVTVRPPTNCRGRNYSPVFLL